MLKFLIIMTLVIYLIFKVGQFLFRILILGAGGQDTFRKQQHRQQRTSHYKKEGVSIDYYPDEEKKGESNGYQGGEYVDYEEVK